MTGGTSSSNLDFHADFPVPTLAAWRAQVERDLGKRCYADLFWATDEGFTVEPLTPPTRTRDLPHLDPQLGTAALLQHPGRWQVRERIAAGDPERANDLARAGLEEGADQVLLVLDLLGQMGIDPLAAMHGDDMASRMAGTAGIAIYDESDLSRVLAGIDISKVPLAFEGRSSSLSLLLFMLGVAEQRGIDPSQLDVDLGMDPLHEILFLDPSGSGPEQLLWECSETVGWCTNNALDIRPIAVHSHEYHRCGGNVVQEVGCVLAAAIEYIRYLLRQRHDLHRILASMSMRVQVGTELYLEIAKLRALRLLWAKVVRAFGATAPDLLRVSIHAETSDRSRAVWRDNRGNLLRTTVQSFAAVVAGCDSLAVLPYDLNRSTADGTSAALARNQQLLLREESYLDRVADPCAGSYALESLTHEVAQAAWSLVQEIEGKGGIMRAITSGWLAEQISDAAAIRADTFRTRKRIMVGVSRYVDHGLDEDNNGGGRPQPAHSELFSRLEQRKSERDPEVLGRAVKRLHSRRDREDLISTSLPAALAGATIGELVSALRGSKTIEIAKLFNDYTGTDGLEFEELRNLPVNLPVTIVSTGQHEVARARAEFARTVFNVGGFAPSDVGHHDHITDLLQAANAEDRALTVTIPAGEPGHEFGEFRYGTRLLVVCADDDSYADVLSGLVRALPDKTKRETLIFVVGQPRPGLNDYVDSFLFQGMDVPEFVENLHQQVFGTPYARWRAERLHLGAGNPEDPGEMA